PLDPESSPIDPLLEVWTTLSALARDTERLRLGASVLAVGYRNPALLAKMTATLDVISGGRVEMGIGAGWVEAEYRAYGYEFPKASVRIAQMEEAIRIMKCMWTEPEPTFEGAHFRIERAYCNPPPLQKPHPPIWVGGEGPKVLGVAARYADGFNARYWPPERFTERAEELAAGCRAAGRDPEEFRSSVMVLIVPEKDPARAEAERRNFPPRRTRVSSRAIRTPASSASGRISTPGCAGYWSPSRISTRTPNASALPARKFFPPSSRRADSRGKFPGLFSAGIFF
ncbi:MAG: TIGR03619 family F420-dependent LLM class oxidoreductase, partial [Nitrospinota bacterium]